MVEKKDGRERWQDGKIKKERWVIRPGPTPLGPRAKNQKGLKAFLHESRMGGTVHSSS